MAGTLEKRLFGKTADKYQKGDGDRQPALFPSNGHSIIPLLADNWKWRKIAEKVIGKMMALLIEELGVLPTRRETSNAFRKGYLVSLRSLLSEARLFHGSWRRLLETARKEMRPDIKKTLPRVTRPRRRKKN